MSDLLDRQAALKYIEKTRQAAYKMDDMRKASRIKSCMNLLEKVVMKQPSTQPDNDMIHLQKEQAYLQGWEEGREALRKEMLEAGWTITTLTVDRKREE